jgi:spermidine/putrescine transport system substrate-binding protein
MSGRHDGPAFLPRRTVLRAALGAVAGLAAPSGSYAQSTRLRMDRHAPEEDLPRSARSTSGALNLFTWEYYAPRYLVEQFQRETDIKVTVTHYASNAELIAKLKERTPGIDLVQPSMPMIPAAMDDELYQPVDLGRIRNAKHLIPSMLRASEDFGAIVDETRYGLPFAWGAEGIVYNTRSVSRRPDSFGVLHDPAYRERATYRATFHIFVSTGLWLGLGNRMRDIYVSAEKARPILNRILAVLMTEKKDLRGYWSTVEDLEELLGEDEVAVAQAWDTTGWELERRGKPVKFVAPREGAMAWVDAFAIPKDAKNLEQAYAWIDFMYEPRNAAYFTNDLGYGTAVAGTAEFLDPEVRRRFEESFAKGDLENLWWYGPERAWWLALMRSYVERLKTTPPEWADYPIEVQRLRRTRPRGLPDHPGLGWGPE